MTAGMTKILKAVCLAAIFGSNPVAHAASVGMLGVEVTKFPFRIGRKSDHEGASAFFRVDLSLGDRRPYSVSRGHCMIECKGGKYFVRDCASRLGTTVNGQLLGGGESEIVAEPCALMFVIGMKTSSRKIAGVPPGKPSNARL